MTATRRSPRLQVWLAEEYTNAFTGLTWRKYAASNGDSESICVRSYLARRKKTKAQTRAEAARIMNGRRR